MIQVCVKIMNQRVALQEDDQSNNLGDYSQVLYILASYTIHGFSDVLIGIVVEFGVFWALAWLSKS